MRLARACRFAVRRRGCRNVPINLGLSPASDGWHDRQLGFMPPSPRPWFTSCLPDRKPAYFVPFTDSAAACVFKAAVLKCSGKRFTREKQKSPPPDFSKRNYFEKYCALYKPENLKHNQSSLNNACYLTIFALVSLFVIYHLLVLFYFPYAHFY